MSRARQAADRDLGVALCRDGPAGAAVALPLLEKALTAQPDDLDASEAKGYALVQLGRYAEGQASFQATLDRAPGRESGWLGAADAAARAGRPDDAIASLRRAIAINPLRRAYHADLASLLFRGRDWTAAAAASREAIRLSPADLATRKLLVRTYLRMGDSAGRKS